MSRCTTPRACAAPSARQTWRTMRAASGAAILPTARQKIAELLALEELADHVRAAVFGVVDVVDVDHVGVGDAAGRLGLALKARDDVGLPRELGVQHFDGEALVAEAGVARLVDAAHAAFADDADDLVGIAQAWRRASGSVPSSLSVDEGRGVTRANLEVGRVARLAGGARLGRALREAPPSPSRCRTPNGASPAARSGGSSSWTRFGRVRHRGQGYTPATVGSSEEAIALLGPVGMRHPS